MRTLFTLLCVFVMATALFYGIQETAVSQDHIIMANAFGAGFGILSGIILIGMFLEILVPGTISDLIERKKK